MKRGFWTTMVLAAATAMFVGSLAAPAWAGDEENEKAVTMDQLPKAVKKTVMKEAAGHPLKELEEKVVEGTKVYEAEWIADGQKIEIMVGVDGKVLEREAKPVEKKEAKGEGKGKAERRERAEKGRKEAKAPEACEEKEEHGQKGKKEHKGLTIDQLPKPVKDSILKAAGRHALKEIELKMVFEAEWLVDGKEVEILVNPKGKIVARKVESAEEEKTGEHKDKGVKECPEAGSKCQCGCPHCCQASEGRKHEGKMEGKRPGGKHAKDADEDEDDGPKAGRKHGGKQVRDADDDDDDDARSGKRHGRKHSKDREDDDHED